MITTLRIGAGLDPIGTEYAATTEAGFRAAVMLSERDRVGRECWAWRLSGPDGNVCRVDNRQPIEGTKTGRGEAERAASAWLKATPGAPRYVRLRRVP